MVQFLKTRQPAQGLKGLAPMRYRCGIAAGPGIHPTPSQVSWHDDKDSHSRLEWASVDESLAMTERSGCDA
ncbi:MAG: hypothetical protein EBY28_22310 [Betaproteobacteria bacterium]|nr:hypothetical protein [Betaproteobacteria bacterium]